jgi:hypothetical protein
VIGSLEVEADPAVARVAVDGGLQLELADALQRADVEGIEECRGSRAAAALTTRRTPPAYTGALQSPARHMPPHVVTDSAT